MVEQDHQKPLPISKILDLNLQSDRRLLFDAAHGAPSVLSLLNRCLEDYLGYFNEPHWRMVYPGGLAGIVNIVVAKDRSQGHELLNLLTATEALLKLKKYRGFVRLIRGLRDPASVAATLFEIAAANWCNDRSVTLSLEFSPDVQVKDHIKRPDFSWTTTVGHLYCECKSAHEFENSFMKRFQELSKVINAAYNMYEPWDSSLRLDVRLDGSAKNGVERRLRNVISQVAAGRASNLANTTVYRDQEVTAMLCKRDHLIPQESDSIMTRSVKVGPTPTELRGPDAHKNTHLSFTISIARERQRAAARLLKEARTQMPKDMTGAIFIDVGGINAVQKDFETRICHPAYNNTPWVSLWVGCEIATIVFRNGQPFDGRISEPLANLSTLSRLKLRFRRLMARLFS